MPLPSIGVFYKQGTIMKSARKLNSSFAGLLEEELESFFTTRVREEWDSLSDEECSSYVQCLKSKEIDSIFSKFNAGDRLYGFNGGTVPYIMVFYRAKLFDPYSLIIDPLYNVFLKLDHDVLGLPAFDKNNFHESCVNYHRFCHRDTKLKELLKRDLSDRTQFADACIRMCKLGIVQTLLEGNKIYFVLDGLDINNIIAKADKKRDKVPVGYYTNKELRFCYRLSIMSQQLADGISFWNNGKRVPAPWVNNPDIWEDYKPKMVGYEEIYDSYLRNVPECFSQTTKP